MAMEKSPARNGGRFGWVPLLLLFACVALGAWARVVNAGSSASLWFDEAWRIQRLLDADSLLRQIISPPNHIDPPVFSLAIYLLAQIRNTELVLRLVSIIPGVLAILAAYLVGRQLFSGRWTALLAAFLVAFAPWTTIFSKELKPYSLGLLVHLSVLYGFLRYWRRPELRWKVMLATTMLCAVFFSPNIVFAFPGICILMLVQAGESKNRRQFMETLVACAVMLAGTTIYYAAFLHSPGNTDFFDPLKNYWQDHFCPHGSFPASASWFFQRYLALYQKIGFAQYAIFKDSGTVLKALYPLMALAGALIVLVRSRRHFFRLFCLLLLPVLVMVPFNLAGLWPFGPLRMNLFLLAYVLFPSLLLLDEIQRVRPRTTSFLPVGLAVVLLMALQFPVAFSDHAQRRVIVRDSAGALTNLILSTPGQQPVPLLVNRAGMPSFVYYTRHHETVSELFNDHKEKFRPLILHDKDSRLYTTGLLLRACQENRLVATYASQYSTIDQLLFDNDFSVARNNFTGQNVNSCILHSAISGYKDKQKPLFSSKWFSGSSDPWKALYISPPQRLHNPAPGTMVVVNFDLKFRSKDKFVRFRFFNQDGSRKYLVHSSIQNVTKQIPKRIQSAVHTRIIGPVDSFRLVLSASGEYDFVIENVTWFLVPAKDETPQRSLPEGGEHLTGDGSRD